ncbi:RNA-binding transcriptional accessory protein [Candidatus Bipolaricaulota bacterium]|nr:RNA-binding transcriptional accessory protein [Candidatus Bipolaricaulota bacterium]
MLFPAVLLLSLTLTYNKGAITLNTPIERVAKKLEIPVKNVESVKSLLDDRNTIPFIARYRKEMTGSLDEVQIGGIRDELERIEKLEDRRKTIIRSLKDLDELTEELKEQLDEATSVTELEDIYLPFRPKRKTRGDRAREKGLEPLANIIQEEKTGLDPVVLAKDYVEEDKGVEAIEDALAGARDIIAERINEDKKVREEMRRLFRNQGMITSRLKNPEVDEGEKYREYYDFNSKAKSSPSHRILAILRGEREDVLSVKVRPPQKVGLDRLSSLVRRGNTTSSEQVEQALQDCYTRLLAPSLETEIRNDLKERADGEAIAVFGENLEELLMSPPLGQVKTLGVDPGFRSGCKVASLNAHGDLLEAETIFPNKPQNKKNEAAAKVKRLVDKHKPEAVAIGDGTASRETEAFIRNLGSTEDLTTVRVREDGASVYSASEIAREEFPDQDVTVRGAVSIGRRLQDPLAELVKIDPKALGVGQYQHDVDQARLSDKLTEVVERCVNRVGVNVNTASRKLLTYVSGLGPTLAENVIEYRSKNGTIDDIEQLTEVPMIGSKTFEQAAGFLRIVNGDNPLDNSGVHPENYRIVEDMASDLGLDIFSMIGATGWRDDLSLESYVSTDVGIPTLRDILEELDKPGRDPRGEFSPFAFSEKVSTIDDMRQGMVLPGIVTNVTDFGAFVDIGIKTDGLLHISQLSEDYVSHPREVVSLNQRLDVKVIKIDKQRRRISLSLIF